MFLVGDVGRCWVIQSCDVPAVPLLVGVDELLVSSGVCREVREGVLVSIVVGPEVREGVLLKGWVLLTWCGVNVEFVVWALYASYGIIGCP